MILGLILFIVKVRYSEGITPLVRITYLCSLSCRVTQYDPIPMADSSLGAAPSKVLNRLTLARLRLCSSRVNWLSVFCWLRCKYRHTLIDHWYKCKRFVSVLTLSSHLLC